MNTNVSTLCACWWPTAAPVNTPRPMTLLVELVADVLINWKLSAPEVPAEPVPTRSNPGYLLSRSYEMAVLQRVA